MRDYYNDKLNFKNEFDLNIALTSFALINIDEFDKTYRKPKDGEGRWWRTSEILETFASRYAYFDAKRATPTVLGKSMNNYRFGFRHRMVNGCSEYWLCEK